MTINTKTLSKGQIAYEQERARKAGKSLDEWLKQKARSEAEAAKQAASKPTKKPGLISRLLDKAHKPI
ncbi:hypothetical protein [Acidocella sp.]|uniref:hypothetical protein n=1 Tax=Acidocella sp. TaxID=50710 RepID=UPI00262F35E4|nr:hypothetical protein [Acidocella sp.]